VTQLQHFDVLDNRVTAIAFPHEIQTSKGVVPCWSYVSRGLCAFGQKEIVITLRQPNGAPREGRPLGPIHFLRAIAPLAAQGRIVEAGDFTETGPTGLWGHAALRGVTYAPASLSGIPLPLHSLAAIALFQQELDTAKQFGALRVLARIGRAFEYYPTAPWCDSSREAVTVPGEETILDKGGRARFKGTYAVTDGSQIVLRMRRSEVSVISKALAGALRTVGLALLASLDVRAEGCLAWSPGQTGPYAIVPPGSRGRRVSGCFVLLLPDQREDGGQIFEDGFVVFLTGTDWDRLLSALRSGEAMTLPATMQGKGFALEWYDGPELVDSVANVAIRPAMPSTKVSPLSIQSVALYQPDQVLKCRLPNGAATLGSYVQAMERELGGWYAEHSLGRTARALIVALAPTGHAFWLLDPTGAVAPETRDVRALLETVPRPEVEEGPVAFAVLCNLGERFKTEGGPLPPAPTDWHEVARGAGRALSLDEILRQLLG
jgi:hypothetical protein